MNFKTLEYVYYRNKEIIRNNETLFLTWENKFLESMVLFSKEDVAVYPEGEKYPFDKNVFFLMYMQDYQRLGTYYKWSKEMYEKLDYSHANIKS